MHLNTYQEKAVSTALYPGTGQIAGLVYVALGLGESGEAQGKVKKLLRDNHLSFSTENHNIPSEIRNAIIAELGDSLWYIANMAKELGYNLEEVAWLNIDKLDSRAKRGVLGGSGDNR